MQAIEQSWGETDAIQLTLDVSDGELEQRVQDQISKGICSDMMLLGQCDAATGFDDIIQKPIVIVERPGPPRKNAADQQLKTGSIIRSGRQGRKRDHRHSPHPSSIPEGPENVDVVFVEEDRDSSVFAIEVCPSSSDRVGDLQKLRRVTP